MPLDRMFRRKKKRRPIYPKPIAYAPGRMHLNIDHTNLLKALRRGTGKKVRDESAGK
ncbi:MAG: hypothetical protein HY544_05385 [Candidatus Diapherotrites archaeon]|uniref:Uncharacterized protein n=1 Tax=Candidatus Iainarchaeum sp. TaxID=3101447 RepID=A0A8T3YK48_9ARCH|nr:hypothetical protein [Candidatus Diapherotrites archaeon]